MIRIPYLSGQHQNRKINQTIQQLLSTEEEQIRLTRFFLGKTTRYGNTVRHCEKLIELGKECDFPEFSSELLI